jgi:hypothetical protein
MRAGDTFSAVAIALALVMPAAHEPSAQSERASKPVSFAILEDYDKGADLSEVDADFALYEELEIRTWRGSFGWDDYEPSRGRYDFAWLDEFADLAARRSLTLRPYIGYTPEWAARRGGSDADAWNNPPASTRRWREFASRLARELRRHENIVSYEVYNEENVAQWWDASPRDYRETLVAGSQAIRAANPSASVLLGGLVFPDTRWIEQVCSSDRADRSFSVLPVHAYPETWTPADVTVENYLDGLSDFIEAADEACGRKTIWINETGYATTPGRSERDQANWWVRAVATFLAAPRVEHIGVYEIKDLPLTEAVIGDAPNYHLGLTRVDRTRKLAFYTVDMLTDLLDTGRLIVADDDAEVSAAGEKAGELHHHLFVRPDGARVLFVWDRTASSTVTVRVRGEVRSVTELQLDGRPVEYRDAAAEVLSRVTLARGEPRIFRLVP